LLTTEIDRFKAFYRSGQLTENDYDIINGLAGNLPFLLLDPNQGKHLALAKRTLTLFVTSVLQMQLSKKNALVLREKNNGSEIAYYNLGMSHGLSALSAAACKGIIVPNQLNAISFLQLFFHDTQMVFTSNVAGRETQVSGWSGTVAIHNQTKEVKEVKTLERMSWCYGTPGILYSQFLAANALHDSEAIYQTITAFENATTLPLENFLISSPTICHGYSGVLLIYNELARKTGNVKFSRFRDQIVQKLLSTFSPAYEFGFYEYDKVFRGTLYNKARRFKDTGILNGSSGVILSLLSTKSSAKEWENMFLFNK